MPEREKGEAKKERGREVFVCERGRFVRVLAYAHVCVCVCVCVAMRSQTPEIAHLTGRHELQPP